MSNYIKNLKLIILLLTIFFTFPLESNAAISNVSGSSCSGVTIGTNIGTKKYADPNPYCKDNETVNANEGMYDCARNSVYIWMGSVYTDPNQSGKRIKSYYHLPIRIDMWANSSSNWNSNSAFGIATCPGMDLKYTNQSTLEDSVINYFSDNNFKNIKITNITATNLSDKIVNNSMSPETIKNLGTYKIKNYSITSNSNGWNISNSSKQIKYTVNITDLTSNNDFHGLGVNGTNAYLIKSGARALHYYLPITIEFEHDNPDYVSNPCVDGSKEETKKYAYENPNTCCWEYPETCCGLPNFIEKIKQANTEVVDFCCNYKTVGPYAYFKNDTSFPKLTNFYFYPYTTTENKNIIDGLCNCKSSSDYKTYVNSQGELEQSYCCKYGPDKDKYSEQCEIKNSCDDPAYLSYNIDECCSGANYNKYKEYCPMPDVKWKASYTGASCKTNPSNTSAFGENSVANGTRNIIGSGSITESVTFTNYNTLNYMKSNIVKAGTGFNYDVTLKHSIVKNANTQYNYSSCTSASCAKNRAQSAINDFLNMTSSQIQSINNVSDKFKFYSTIGEERYISDEPQLSNTKSYQNTVWATYTDPCCSVTNGSCNSCTRSTQFTTTTRIQRDYTYNLSLEDKYIAKLNGNIATNKKDYKEYIYGGKKFYTETTTQTGIYDFNIKLDGSATGVTGNLSNYQNGFKCQYGVVNKIKNDGDFTNGNITSGVDPLPVPGGVGRGFYFRQISLSTPFPNNRVIGSNWNKYCSSGTNCSYITKSGEHDSYGSEGDNKSSDVYKQTPMYKITMDSNFMSQIKNYNKDNDYDYGWDGMESKVYNKLDSTSSFIDDFSVFIQTRSGLQRDVKVGDFK